MLKFSCSDYTFPLLSRRQSLQLISLLGIEQVDLGLFARTSHLSPFELMKDPRSFTAALKDDLSDVNLAVSDLFLQIGEAPHERAANDPDAGIREENREVFQHALRLCPSLGCMHMTGLPGVVQSGISASDGYSLAVTETAWRLEEAKQAGVVYSIEPHLGSICPTTKSAKQFLDDVKGLTLTLDYGHFIFAGEGSADVHPLVAHASHVHVRSGAPGKLQTVIKENTIDFVGLLERLEGNYDGVLCLEYVWVDWEGCNRVDNVSETLLLQNYIRDLVRGQN
jgi:sugar phosphate isomerase/epimerase